MCLLGEASNPKQQRSASLSVCSSTRCGWEKVSIEGLCMVAVLSRCGLQGTKCSICHTELVFAMVVVLERDQDPVSSASVTRYSVSLTRTTVGELEHHPLVPNFRAYDFTAYCYLK